MKKMPSVTKRRTGSGVLIRHLGGTYVLTAAHICKGNVAPVSMSRHGVTVTVDDVVKVGISAWGFHSMAKISKIDHKKDLCLLKLSAPRCIPGAIVSSSEPKLGDVVYYAGAPLAYMSNTSLLMFDGKYSGFYGRKSLFSLPCVSGSSGSGIRNKRGEIVSIVQSVDRRFHRICLGSTLGDIRAFLLR